MNAPLIFEWTGEAMVPLPRFRKAADEAFVVHERYRMTIEEERSMRSHRHYFAMLHDAWMNLPEDQAERFPTSEHLRKWCLIRAGYSDERSIVCASKAEAQRVAAFIRPIDSYAIVTVSEAVVRVFTAQSQSVKAMGHKVFQQSKDKVLEIAAGLIGVSPDTLAREAA